MNPSNLLATLMSTQLLARISSLRFRMLDDHLLRKRVHPELVGISRFFIEFLYFGMKEARACLFVVLFFTAVFSIPREGLWGVPRYDVLLLVALLIQAWMVCVKLETIDELKAITIFHVAGFALEVFKTSSEIQSWAYPDFAYTKLLGVPLFSVVVKLNWPQFLIHSNIVVPIYSALGRHYIDAVETSCNTQ
jgi:uncharacterized membrane protein YoaT (DUF817 family)